MRAQVAAFCAVVLVAACGFKPVHTPNAEGRTPAALTDWQVPDSPFGRLLDREMAAAIRKTSAGWRADITATLTRQDMQLDSTGVAQRQKRVYVLEVRLVNQAGQESKGQRFTDEQFVTLGSSGAEALMQGRAADEAAAARLASRLARFVAAQTADAE